jgi:hypothetical protein
MRCIVAWALCALPLHSFADVTAQSPLRVRNLAPAAQLYGLPSALGGEIVGSAGEWSISTEVANDFTRASNPTTDVSFDGESIVLTASWRQSLTPRLEWMLDVPYVTYGGGFMDGPIEAAHNIVGFEDDRREDSPRNAVRYQARYEGTTYLALADDSHDLGDVRIMFGYQAVHGPARSIALRTMVKAPTGTVERLSGSGATDASLWLEWAERRVFGSERWSTSAGAGATWLGRGDLAPQAQEDVAFWGHLGTSFGVRDTLALLGQLDHHTRLVDTGLEQLAEESTLLSLGARWTPRAALRIDLALVENVDNRSASDFAVQLILAARR